MKNLFCLGFSLVYLCFLFSCTSSSPSDAVISTDIPKTNVAMPTSTLTPKASDTPTHIPVNIHESTSTNTPQPTSTSTAEPTSTLDLESCDPTIITPPEFTFYKKPAAFAGQVRCFLVATNSSSGLKTAIESVKGEYSGVPVRIYSQVRSADVNSDGSEDVLVYIKFSLGDTSSETLLIFSGADRQYERIFELDLGGQTLGESDGIRAVADMNKNGIPEIVFSYIENRGNAGSERYFRILEWSAGTMVDLVQSTYIWVLVGSSYVQDDMVVMDWNNDGKLELLLTNDIPGGLSSCDYGPMRETTQVWAWDGEAYSFERSLFAPPEYRFQAARDGDYESKLGEFETALKFYQQAIFDESLKPGSRGDWTADKPWCGLAGEVDPYERLKLEAYSRYRIILLHVVSTRLTSARVVYETLMETFPNGTPGHQYADMANEFWQAFVSTEDIGDACEAAIEFAALHSEEILDPLGHNVYGYAYSDYEPEDICPFP